MNIKTISLLLIYFVSTSLIQAISVNLYNSSGEPLSISYMPAGKNSDANKKIKTETLYHNTSLTIDTAGNITINKTQGKSITISVDQTKETSDAKVFIIEGIDVNNNHYSDTVRSKKTSETSYLIIKSDNPKYNYTIKAKNPA